MELKKAKYNFDKFFKRGDGETYILVSRKLVHYMSSLKTNELLSIMEQKFEEFC